MTEEGAADEKKNNFEGASKTRTMSQPFINEEGHVIYCYIFFATIKGILDPLSPRFLPYGLNNVNKIADSHSAETGSTQVFGNHRR